MKLKDRFRKLKTKTKDTIDKGKLIKYVNRLESLFKQGNIEGILEFIKPILESEGYEVDIMKDLSLSGDNYDYVVFIRKAR